MKTLLFAAGTLFLTSVQAQNNPVSFSTDTRIKHVRYQDNNVVPIHGIAFTTTEIQFGDKEEVLDIEGGDSSAWMVTYHPELANVVFVKPTVLNSDTNLTVITNQHAYYFHVTSNTKLERNPAKQTYAVKFDYPVEPRRPATRSRDPEISHNTRTPSIHDNLTGSRDRVAGSRSMPKATNTAYRFAGSPQLVPRHVFDDGKFTYFELSPNGAVPAIFAVDDQSGKESTVNTRREGKYLIVQRLAPQFTLRQGRLSTSVFNTKEIQRIAANRRP